MKAKFTSYNWKYLQGYDMGIPVLMSIITLTQLQDPLLCFKDDKSKG